MRNLKDFSLTLRMTRGKSRGNFMNVDFIFKIAAIGIIVAVLSLVLSRSGREEQAMMTTLSGLIVVLLMLVQKIADLFHTIETLFGF